MPIILSLQGCMACGKTTAVRYIKENAPYINISYEENAYVIGEIRKRKLNKNDFADYVEIQKLWIANEVARYDRAKQFSCSIMDFGAEEIEFYTLNYPKSINAHWNVEESLHSELQQLRQCMPQRILFLNASEAVLRAHKDSDETRSRTFFDYHLEHLLPLKKAWFIGKPNVDVLNIDSLSKEQVGKRVKEWIDCRIADKGDC
ncbi:MAG: hypothetical protein RSD78_07745 [Oscillospiraceae bacterium]